jgi:uncharacterized protein (TIGR00297 family)
MQFVTGFILALCISLTAYALRSLNRSGAIAAIIMGTIVYGFGGWQAAVILLVFFLSSSLLDRLLRPLGRRPAGAYAKGGQRDAGQVLGNGLVAAVFAVLTHVIPGAAWPWIGFAGSIAAVNADTWATELGILSRRAPRLITRLRQSVEPGTSGGVSVEGTVAGLLGATLVGAFAALLTPAGLGLFFPTCAAGLAGSLFDSYLGATVQCLYVCTKEGVETEQHPIHRCGSPTVHSRGWTWLNNDLVNFGCAVFGALTACLIMLATGAF